MAVTSRLRIPLALARLVREPSLEAMHPAEVRRELAFFQHTFARLSRAPAVPAETCALRLPGRDVPVRIYRPAGSSSSSRALVFFHGGGWVAGGLDSHDRACRALAVRAGVPLVSVDYRLAPEHRFPAAADDAFDALALLHREAAAYGLPADGLVLAGDSAGGNLAAVTAIRARDAGIPVRGQVLVYPVVEADFESASYRDNAVGYVLTRDRMRFFWDAYTPDAATRTDPRVAPLRAPLEGLPPALVITAELDVLRTEGIRYAQALGAASVPVEHLDVPGVIHGFVSLQGLLPEADAAHAAIAAFVARV